MSGSQVPNFDPSYPDILRLNIDRVDLSWTCKYLGGEDTENEDDIFILDKLKWGVNRLANGRINNSLEFRLKKRER